MAQSNAARTGLKPVVDGKQEEKTQKEEEEHEASKEKKVKEEKEQKEAKETVPIATLMLPWYCYSYHGHGRGPGTQTLSMWKWIALAMLMSGVALVQWPSGDQSHRIQTQGSRTIGVIAVRAVPDVDHERCWQT